MNAQVVIVVHKILPGLKKNPELNYQTKSKFSSCWPKNWFIKQSIILAEIPTTVVGIESGKKNPYWKLILVA